MILLLLLTLAMSLKIAASTSDSESSWSVATTVSSEHQDRNLESRVVSYRYKSWQTTTYPDGTTTRQEFEFTTGAGDDLADLEEGVCETELENVESPMNRTEAAIYCHNFKDVFNLAFANDPCDFELDYCRVFSQHFTVTTYQETRFVSGGGSRHLRSAAAENLAQPQTEQGQQRRSPEMDRVAELPRSSRNLTKRIKKRKKNKVRSKNRGRCNTECPVEELFFEYLNTRRTLQFNSKTQNAEDVAIESLQPVARSALRRRSAQTSPSLPSSTTTNWKPLEESQLSPEERKKIEEFQTKELGVFCYNFLKTMAIKQDLNAFYGMSAISVQCAKTKVRCNIELGGGDSTSTFFNPPEWDGE